MIFESSSENFNSWRAWIENILVDFCMDFCCPSLGGRVLWTVHAMNIKYLLYSNDSLQRFVLNIPCFSLGIDVIIMGVTVREIHISWWKHYPSVVGLIHLEILISH